MSAYEPFHQHDLTRFAYYCSLLGVVIAVLGIFISIFAAISQLGINVLQMRIDQLGDYLNSPLAYVFNISLLLCGAFFTFAMGGLIRQRFSHSADLLAIFGGITGMGLVIVGWYPYNDIKPHQVGELIYVVGSILVFSMLIYSFFYCKMMCGRITLGLSILGLISGIELLRHVNLGDLDYHVCDHGDCYLYPVMWLHSLMAIFTALSMASTVMRLGVSRQQLISEI
ncbi:hypothetical protein JYB87_15370 [Shewanella avicenniae]|uniref:DUF998 domain-containing protein n=1 Tax=Shewanella avicenniae TaxID=2814294 RepID=A0ABX7QQD3_9GAMM|nr:hypothetical protein [Shewanella avicenniae]QSX33090.1 hypothetical protein JYB87_15370 [Shewanella avicenniae]